MIDYGFAMRAMVGDIANCGDLSYIRDEEDYCFLTLIDVLGHGPEARKVALIAEDYIKGKENSDLLALMNGLHEHLFGSRGAVLVLCRLDKHTGILSYCGIGNISMRIIGGRSQRMVLRDGVVGYGRIRPRLEHITLSPGDILLLHSDGIREHTLKGDCGRFLLGTGTESAEQIMRHCSKDTDDASCIVLNYLN